MNAFQAEAVSALQDLARSMNTSLEVEQNVDATRYVQCKFIELDIWIYPEGSADFASSYIDRRFEKFDFDNSTKLIQKLTKSIEEVIKNRDHYFANPEKDPAPILDRILQWIHKLR